LHEGFATVDLVAAKKLLDELKGGLDFT